MLVITAKEGDNARKEPSLSSASATITSPSPSLALLPILASLPPITIVGSSPPDARTVAIMEVVVVFPWLPDTAMENFILSNSASISARGMTGIFLLCASKTSGLSSFTAVDVTTTSASARWEASCPEQILAPREASLCVISD